MSTRFESESLGLLTFALFRIGVTVDRRTINMPPLDPGILSLAGADWVRSAAIWEPPVRQSVDEYRYCWLEMRKALVSVVAHGDRADSLA